MKTFLFMLLCSATLISCNKYGCTDPTAINYSERNTKDDGSCAYNQDIPDEVFSATVDSMSWSYYDPSWEVNLIWPLITQDVYENGGIIAYARPVTSTTWYSLPMTFYLSSTYSTSIEIRWEIEQCTILWTDSDLTQPVQPPSMDIKLVIVH